MSEDFAQYGASECSVVVCPPSHFRIEHPSQIVDLFVRPPGDPPAPDFPSDRFRRLVADRWRKPNEDSSSPIIHASRPEGVAKEIERRIGIVSVPSGLLAVDNSRLGGMKFQPALREPLLEGSLEQDSLIVRCAVQNSIIRVAFKVHAGMMPSYPLIKTVMQIQIRQ